MERYTQKELKRLVRIGAATDITGYGFSQMNDFLNSRNLNKVGYSSGTYGINGGLLQDRKTNELFAITARNTACMMAF